MRFPTVRYGVNYTIKDQCNHADMLSLLTRPDVALDVSTKLKRLADAKKTQKSFWSKPIDVANATRTIANIYDDLAKQYGITWVVRNGLTLLGVTEDKLLTMANRFSDSSKTVNGAYIALTLKQCAADGGVIPANAKLHSAAYFEPYLTN